MSGQVLNYVSNLGPTGIKDGKVVVLFAEFMCDLNAMCLHMNSPIKRAKLVFSQNSCDLNIEVSF